MARIRLQPVATKLTCPSPTTSTTGARGLPRFHAGNEEPLYTCETSTSFTRKPEKHKLCLSCIYYTTYTISIRKDDKPTVSLRTDDNGTPATWTLVLFQQATDWQDRTS